MKKILLMSFFVFAVNTPLLADEIGDKAYIVADPIAEPLRVTNGNSSKTRYWNCTGLVNKKVLNIAKRQLTTLSKQLGVSPPGNFCIYSILEFEGVSGYAIEYYGSKEDFARSENKNKNSESRLMAFRPKNGEVLFHYWIDSPSNNVLKEFCMDREGEKRTGCLGK